MSLLDNHSKIRSMAENHEVQPPAFLWNKVEDKLKAAKLSRKRRQVKKLYFFTSIAAGFLILFGVFSFIYIESLRPQIVEKGKVESWEHLKKETDYFYSIKNARISHKYFQNLRDSEGQSISSERTSGLPVLLRNNSGKYEW